MSLTKDDLENIKEIVTTAVDELAVTTKNGFDDIDKKMVTKNELKNELKDTEESIKKELRKDIRKEGQDVRDYTDRELRKLKGDLTSYDKKIIEKADTLTETLEKKRVITQDEKVTVTRLSPFPVSPGE